MTLRSGLIHAPLPSGPRRLRVARARSMTAGSTPAESIQPAMPHMGRQASGVRRKARPTVESRLRLTPHASRGEGIHQPGHGERPDDQRQEELHEERDPLPPPASPEEREEERNEQGIYSHDQEVIRRQQRGEHGQDFLSAAMSKASSISSRFMSPAVSRKAQPYSYV